MNLHLSTDNFELKPKIKAYANEKIGGLEKYLPKPARSATVQITLGEDQSGREDNRYYCEVIMRVPGATIQAKEATLNMFAAVDIVEAKIKSQILKYKTKQQSNRPGRLLKLITRRKDAQP